MTTLLSGWGRVTSSAARYVEAAQPADLARLAMVEEPRGRIARGSGRSYGDCALNGGGLVVDCRPLDTIRELDAHAGTITVDAGVTIEGLLRFLVPRGWFPAVVPGTRFVTVGGAIANDVHGKNHHRDGAFGAHLVALDLVTAEGEMRRIAPDQEAELFWATVGGLGLTGFIARATLRLLPIETALFEVERVRFPDLDAVIAAMDGDGEDEASRYSVAWLDLAVGGRHAGRGVLTRGDHLPLGRARDALGATEHPGSYRPRRGWPAGMRLPAAAFGRWPVRLANELLYRQPVAPSGIEGIDAFLFPLDALRDWNRWYGPRGFVQYQCVVPRGREDALHKIARCLADARSPVTVATLKRLGPAGLAPLSFPLDGWTLAADRPGGDPGLGPVLRTLDLLVAEAGGRVYLAKDSRMQPDVLAAMYPRLDEWRAVREHIDPEHRFTSDLARRLGL